MQKAALWLQSAFAKARNNREKSEHVFHSELTVYTHLMTATPFPEKRESVDLTQACDDRSTSRRVVYAQVPKFFCHHQLLKFGKHRLTAAQLEKAAEHFLARIDQATSSGFPTVDVCRVVRKGAHKIISQFLSHPLINDRTKELLSGVTKLTQSQCRDSDSLGHSNLFVCLVAEFKQVLLIHFVGNLRHLKLLSEAEDALFS